MKKYKFFLFAMLLSVAFGAKALDIIPYPSSVKETAMSFTFKSTNEIHYSPELKNEAHSLRDLLSNDFSISSKAKKRRSTTGIVLSLDQSLKTELGEEGYILNSDNNKIEINAATHAGIFHGIQTLKQLIKVTSSGEKTVSGVAIVDHPRFPWRAFMLDEARYFKGEQAVKDILDEMARLKLNTFHWHLTDDAGWRIEIKKYPLLTKVGSKRDSSQVGV